MKKLVATLFVGMVLGVVIVLAAGTEGGPKPVTPDAEVEKDDFQLLQFKADWCLFCKIQSRHLRDTKIQKILHEQGVRHLEVDLSDEKNELVAKQWKVSALPAMILVKINHETDKGISVRRIDGKTLKGEELEAFVNPLASWEMSSNYTSEPLVPAREVPPPDIIYGNETTSVENNAPLVLEKD